MAPGTRTKQAPLIMVKVPTHKIIIPIVEMYKSEDEHMKSMALQLAGYIIEAYEDHNQFKKDIFGTYVSGSTLSLGLAKNMKRMFPDETKILEEIFGAFLFGGS